MPTRICAHRRDTCVSMNKAHSRGHLREAICVCVLVNKAYAHNTGNVCMKRCMPTVFAARWWCVCVHALYEQGACSCIHYPC